jgi:hypothetical protein
LGINKANGSYKRAGLGELLLPRIAAVGGAIELSRAVTVPAGLVINERDVVLLATIGNRV